MLSEICLYLKNWFNWNQPKFIEDNITIADGHIVGLEEKIQMNQYYRIVGSVFNDGVYKRGSEELTDETFEGAIWLMAVPADVLSLVAEIEAWQKAYGGVDSQNMSPYQSESFGGYSYSKASGSSSNSDASTQTWQGVFADRLKRYKKI